MSRVTHIYSADQYPHELADGEAGAQLERALLKYERFTQSWPGSDGKASAVGNNWAVLLHAPRFAEIMVDFSDFVQNHLAWCRRAAPRELAILVLFQRRGSDYGFQSHLAPAAAAGVTEGQLADLPTYLTSDSFDEEERDAIAYTHAALDGDVPDELFQRLKQRYGEQQVVEMAVLVGFYSLWAILLDTLRPEYVSA